MVIRTDPFMIRNSPELDEEIPKWDVALEALLREEYQKRRTPLTVDDVQRLSAQYSIRFDDMMHTLFELTIHGLWRYMPAPNVIGEITRAHMDALWAEGRLVPDHARKHYPGAWRAVR
jgi:hypothetical protein